uniref:HAT C-terminal dimerisation domain-containing protein n=1 Tax=Naja naja TaxID=35670 RepID=A0A8C6VDP2_NAJNA
SLLPQQSWVLNLPTPGGWKAESTLSLPRMKRRQSLTAFFAKKPRMKQSESDTTDPQLSRSQAPLPPLECGESSKSISKTENLPDLPDCWILQQYRNFQEKYEGLEVSKKKLGSKYCTKHDFAVEKGVHVSKEWKHFKIEVAGTNKEVQKASLRKKMKEHFTSKVHAICNDNLKQGDRDAITKSVDKTSDKYLSTTRRVVLIVCSLAQRCKPFSDMEGQVELQTVMGVDLGVGLHSQSTAVKIVDFIATEIKTKMFTSIIEQNLKICLIIDKASTLSCKPVVIVFVKVEESDNPPTIFVELVELEKQDAETICSSVLESLHNVGFTTDYLVILGRKSGMSTSMAKDFPNIIISHCLNCCLQLVLDYSIKDIKQLNHFKIFLDKIHSIFHKSCKSQNELFEKSEQLGIEIVKIGRVLGPRWALCSLRSTLSVWHAYPVLHQYFHANEKYSNMAKYEHHKETFKNIKFVQNHQFVGLPQERLFQLQDTTNKLRFLHFLEDFIENVLRDSKNYAIPDNIKKAKDIVRTIAVSSAEAERSFSNMNLICSQQRSRLTVSNITNLMTISVIGLPLKEWDPILTVKKWLRGHHLTADDPRMKIKKSASEEGANERTLWKLLKVKDK